MTGFNVSNSNVNLKIERDKFFKARKTAFMVFCFFQVALGFTQKIDPMPYGVILANYYFAEAEECAAQRYDMFESQERAVCVFNSDHYNLDHGEFEEKARTCKDQTIKVLPVVGFVLRQMTPSQFKGPICKEGVVPAEFKPIPTCSEYEALHKFDCKKY